MMSQNLDRLLTGNPGRNSYGERRAADGVNVGCTIGDQLVRCSPLTSMDRLPIPNRLISPAAPPHQLFPQNRGNLPKYGAVFHARSSLMNTFSEVLSASFMLSVRLVRELSEPNL